MNTRALHFWNAGTETPSQAFANDQLAMLIAALRGHAVARLWRASDAGLSLGRYHRRDSARDIGTNGLVRRLCGGRIVPQGPGIACLTLAVPQVAWLDPRLGTLRPEQVLNRSLRPLLAALRSAAVDAFYPGRDLVTVSGRTLAHAAFTVARDGALLVQMQIADSDGFDALPRLLERFDPAGVAAVDRNAFDGAATFVELTGRTLDDAGFEEGLAAALGSQLRCEVFRGEPCDSGDATRADEDTFTMFQQEPGPLPEGSTIASAISMLGVVELAARMENGHLHGVRVTGDLIAPFHVIDRLEDGLEGQPAQLPILRRAVARVLSQPGSFVLGMRDLDAVLARLVPQD